MSPSYLAVQKAAAEKRADRACAAGDDQRLQEELVQLTRLARAYYGRPQPHPDARGPGRR